MPRLSDIIINGFKNFNAMFKPFYFHSLPDEGEPFNYDNETVKRMALRALLNYERGHSDYSYGNKGQLICCSEGIFKRERRNLNLASHDAWQLLMENRPIPYSFEGPAYFSWSWSEDATMPTDLVAIRFDCGGEPIYVEKTEEGNGGTTTVLQDKSVKMYYKPSRVRYARKCTDHSMELWVRPFGAAPKEGRDDSIAVLNLTILGGAATSWVDTADKTVPVFGSQRSFVIGGVNAPHSENLFRLQTDTVSDRNLEGRKKRGGWEVRAGDGTVFINGEPVEPGMGWIRLDDSMDITLNETTIKIEVNG